MDPFFDNQHQQNEEHEHLPPTFDLRFNIDSLSNPIYPAICQLSYGMLRNSRRNDHAGLDPFKFSMIDSVDRKIWSWIESPSRSLEEIEVRHSCLLEIIERGNEFRKALSNLEGYVSALRSLSYELGGREEFREFSVPKIERALQEQGVSEVRKVIDAWIQAQEDLKKILGELRKFDSTITYSAVTAVKESIDKMPYPSFTSVEEALEGEPSSFMAMQVEQLFEDTFRFLKDNFKLEDSLTDLIALFSLAAGIEELKMCPAAFSESSEVYRGLYNATFERTTRNYEGASFHQVTSDSPADVPVIVLKASNMGGKTFYLQSRLYLTLFAQSFKFAPAEFALLNLYDSIHAIERGRTESRKRLSSFGSAQAKVAETFNTLGSRGLFLADELASETDRLSEAGLVYGTACTLKDAGARAFIATHSEEAVDELEMEAWAKIYRFAVRPTPWGEIEFTHILEEGKDESYALEVARTLGAPQAVLQTACDYLSGLPLTITPPERFHRAPLPDTDECWKGLGYLVARGRNFRDREDDMEGRSWGSDHNFLTHLAREELDFFRRGSRVEAYWKDPLPNAGRGFVMYLTRDKDFLGDDHDHESPFFGKHNEEPLHPVRFDDLVSTLSQRPRPWYGKPGDSFGSILSLSDVEARRTLFRRLGEPGVCESLESLCEDLRTAHYRWEDLIGHQSDVHSARDWYKGPIEMARRIIETGIGLRTYAGNDLGKLSWERALAFKLIRELVSMGPECALRDEAVKEAIHFERGAGEISNIWKNVHGVKKRRKQIRLTLEELAREAEWSKERSLNFNSPYVEEYFWRDSFASIAYKLHAMPAGSEFNYEGDPRFPVAARLFDEALELYKSFPAHDDLDYTVRSLRAYVSNEDYREKFLSYLKELSIPQLKSSIGYYRRLFTAFFGKYHRLEDVLEGRKKLLQRLARKDYSWSIYEDGGGHFGGDSYLALSHQYGPLVLAARLGQHFRKEAYCDTEFRTDYGIHAKKLYHPERQKKSFIPNDINIDENTRLFIVSGPNMSGKSELLKTLVWLVLTSRNAGVAAAKSASIAPFSRIVYLDRVSEDSNEGLSGWGTDISNMNSLCSFVGIEGVEEHPALVVLNEFGTSTTAREQGAIKAGLAKALIEAGHTVIYEGHDHRWIDRVSEECVDICKVAHLSYDMGEDGEVKFHYKLVSGATAPSLGLEVARKLAVPPAVLDYAKRVVERYEGSAPDKLNS